VGFSSTNPGGYAIDGGEGRSHVVPSPTIPAGPSHLPPAPSPLAVQAVPMPRLNPFLRVQTADRFVPPVVAAAVPAALPFRFSRGLVNAMSAPAPAAPTRPASFLSAKLAPFRGVSKNFNPTATAIDAHGLPVPRLLLAGVLIAGWLAGGGAWRWVALAGAGLAASSLYTFATAGK